MLSSLYDLAARLLLRSKRKPSLLVLSNDILVDQIIVYLSVVEVIALRCVNRFFYSLTHQPIIWKRLIRTISIPLPPLPPTSGNTLANITGIEAEQLIIRAYSLDDNWRREKPKAFRNRKVSAHDEDEVLDLAIVSGGRYLVTSSAVLGRVKHCITIYHMDHPSGAAQPFAQFMTETKAYGVQARFMTWKDRQGIMVAYLRRMLHNPSRDWIHRVNPSQFSADAELGECPVPLDHEANVFFISLDSIEKLLSRNVGYASQLHAFHMATLPTPFEKVACIRSTRVLAQAALEIIKGEPYLALRYDTDSLLLKNLETEASARLTCDKWDIHNRYEQPIRAFKVLPGQEEIFVIREIWGEQTNKLDIPIYSFEAYEIPAPGDALRQPSARTGYRRQGVKVLSFHWGADRPLVARAETEGQGSDKSVQPTMKAWTDRVPTSLSLYGRLAGPQHGFVHIKWQPYRSILFPAYPQPSQGAPVQYIHPLVEGCSVTLQSFHGNEAWGSALIYPGSTRAIVVSVPQMSVSATPELLRVWSYVSKEDRSDALAPEHPEDAARRKAWDEQRVTLRRRPMAPITLPSQIREDMRRGIAAFAWDETIGRACMVAHKDTKIYVVDLAASPREDTDVESLLAPLDSS